MHSLQDTYIIQKANIYKNRVHQDRLYSPGGRYKIADYIYFNMWALHMSTLWGATSIRE